MSILLALLRSPKPPGASRSRRSNEPKELCTEMGVFTRHSVQETELLEISSFVTPPPAAREGSDHKLSPSTTTEWLENKCILNVDTSFRAFASAEVTFAYEILSSGASLGVNEFVGEAFKRLCWSGSLLCKLLSSALPGSLDERAINDSDGGFRTLTPDDVLENFQLCHSCAHAQGCDLQGISVEQLYACEVSCLTDFVLEVLRLSAVQALPASDRQSLAAPPSQAAAPSSAAGGSFGHTKTTAPGPHNSQELGGEYTLRAHCHGSGNSSRSSDEGGSGGSDGATAVIAKQDVDEHVGPVLASAQQPGTAAARRAVAGLECWALQLVGALPVETSASPAASSCPATPAIVSRTGSRTAAALGPSAALCPVTTGAGAPRANGEALSGACRSTGIAVSCPRGCSSSSSMDMEVDLGSDLVSGQLCKITGADGSPGGRLATAAADGGSGGGAGTNRMEPSHGPAVGAGCCTSEPDSIRLEVWERLVAILSRPLSSDADVESASGPAHTTASNAAGVAIPGEASGAVSNSGSPRTAGEADGEDLSARVLPPDADIAAHACLRVRAPSGVHGAIGDGGEMEARWAEATQALSNALAAGVLTHGSPQLPVLRPEHLQCRHPGLRSLLLARVLLAHCCLRDGLTATAPGATLSRADVSLSGGSSGVYQVDSGEVSPGRAMSGGASRNDVAATAAAAAVVAAAAAAAAKILPGSPAPPLPRLREPAAPNAGGLAVIRRNHSLGGRPPMDLLSEHNLLVQKEHQQRELRRQQRQKRNSAGGSGGGDASGDRPRASAAATEPRVVLWSGDGDDEEGADQEERVLRLWLNSLDPGIHVTSLFAQEITTGWPLLLALEAIQPGCVPWSDAFRPPFKEKLRKILSVQNCNLVIEVCTRQLAMPPLVNIGGLDLALGQRRATLSLVFQMMRHHMGMLLGLVAPGPYLLPPASPQRLPVPSTMPTLGHSYSFGQSYSPSHALGHSYSLNHSSGGHSHSPGLVCGHEVSPHAQHVPYAPSPQRGSRAHVEVEKAVLAWANAKLMEAAVAAAADRGETAEAIPTGSGVAPLLPFTPLASFSDKRLGEGSVMLQLLAAICPRSVNPKYVLPGRNAEERGSNARYLLSCARKLGCVIFLAWEDVVAARPNLLLLLLASFMALDRKRLDGAAAAAATAGAAGQTLVVAEPDANAQAAGGMGGREVVKPRGSASSVAPEPASPYPL